MCCKVITQFMHNFQRNLLLTIAFLLKMSSWPLEEGLWGVFGRVGQELVQFVDMSAQTLNAAFGL